MKQRLALSSLLLLAFTACPSVQMQEWQETTIRKLRVTARVTDIPDGVQEVRVWMPAPVTVHGLELRSPLAVTALGGPFAEKSDAEGNRYLFLQAPTAKDEPISLGYEVTLACSRVPPPMMDGSTSGLWESSPMKLEGDQQLLTQIRKKALIVTAQHPTWFGKARALAGWLLQDFRDGPEQGLALSFEKMRGDRLDMNRLYVTACKSLGMKARIEAGFALPAGEGVSSLDEVLVWTSILIPGIEWIPVDLRDAQLRPEEWESRFGGLDQPRIRMISNEGTDLDPSIGDGIPKLFLKPHAECDGKVWAGLKITMNVKGIANEEE
jgi:Transglutaminase-like superfamily